MNVSLADAKVPKDDVKKLFRLKPPCDVPKLVRSVTQLFGNRHNVLVVLEHVVKPDFVSTNIPSSHPQTGITFSSLRSFIIRPWKHAWKHASCTRARQSSDKVEL
jgi:hypothetical protein